MQIKCDKCSVVSESIMPETYLEGDIEFTFFRCPECGAVYWDVHYKLELSEE